MTWLLRHWALLSLVAFTGVHALHHNLTKSLVTRDSVCLEGGVGLDCLTWLGSHQTAAAASRPHAGLCARTVPIMGGEGSLGGKLLTAQTLVANQAGPASEPCRSLPPRALQRVLWLLQVPGTRRVQVFRLGDAPAQRWRRALPAGRLASAAAGSRARLAVRTIRTWQPAGAAPRLASGAVAAAAAVWQLAGAARQWPSHTCARLPVAPRVQAPGPPAAGLISPAAVWIKRGGRRRQRQRAWQWRWQWRRQRRPGPCGAAGLA